MKKISIEEALKVVEDDAVVDVNSQCLYDKITSDEKAMERFKKCFERENVDSEFMVYVELLDAEGSTYREILTGNPEKVA